MSTLGVVFKTETQYFTYIFSKAIFWRSKCNNGQWETELMFDRTFLDRGEQIDYIKKKICYSRKKEVGVELVKCDIDFSAPRIQFTPQPYTKLRLEESFSTAVSNDEIIDYFLYVLKLGERVQACLDKKKEMEQHKKKMVQVKNELECMPGRGIEYEKCKEDFQSSQLIIL